MHNFDFSNHIERIAFELRKQERLNFPKLICIEGVTGSGKTLLAEELAKTGNNTALINEKNHEQIDHLINDTAVTYIVDDVDLLDTKAYKHISEHVLNGGTMVIFIQRRDLLFKKRIIKPNMDCVFLVLEPHGLI